MHQLKRLRVGMGESMGDVVYEHTAHSLDCFHKVLDMCSQCI